MSEQPMTIEDIWAEYQKTGDYKKYTERLDNYWRPYTDFPHREYYNNESVGSDR